MATETPRTDHVVAMRKRLGEAMADAADGANSLRNTNQIHFTDHAAMAAVTNIATAHFLSSIANSLIVLAGAAVDEAQDAIGMSRLPPVLGMKGDSHGAVVLGADDGN